MVVLLCLGRAGKDAHWILDSHDRVSLVPCSGSLDKNTTSHGTLHSFEFVSHVVTFRGYGRANQLANRFLSTLTLRFPMLSILLYLGQSDGSLDENKYTFEIHCVTCSYKFRNR